MMESINNESQLISHYQKDLLESIPVTSSLNAKITQIRSSSLTICAPLGPNINYEGTVFGGSLNTICILSCYTLVHHFLNSNMDKGFSLVIKSSNIEYLHPVIENFSARAVFEEESKTDFFLNSLKRKGIGRIRLSSTIRIPKDERALIRFTGEFVASYDKSRSR